MLSTRGPWLLVAALMGVAGALVAVGTYVLWLPCRGQMLRDSVLAGTVLDGSAGGGDYTDACLRAMDAGFPYPDAAAGVAALFAAAASVVLGVAWLVLVLVSGWPAGTRALAALPGVGALGLGLAAAIAYAIPGPDSADAVLGALWQYLEIGSLVAVGAAWSTHPKVSTPVLVRLGVVLTGCTALGFLHGMVEYAVMGSFNEANWDMPPGTGYLTAAMIIGCAVVVVVLAPPRRGPDVATAEPLQHAAA